MSNLNRKLTILVFADYYLPGYKAGGPISTLSNLVEHLGDEFSFKIITRDRDLGGVEQYCLEDSARWHIVGKAEVCYLSPEQRSLKQVRKLILEFPYDVIYLTTLFSPCFGIMPILLHKLGVTENKPVIISPKGQLSRSALEFKAFKKNIFLKIAMLFRLYMNVIWQASSQYEFDDIHNVFGHHDHNRSDQLFIFVVPNITTTLHLKGNLPSGNTKIPNHLNVIFLSRISRMKNLHTALKMLLGLAGRINFDLYGPIEDKEYWSECQRLIQLLPENITVKYKGVVPHDDVEDVLSRYHLFLLPSLGENFCHTILEALSAGCPVLISDRTPWRNLVEKGVGWDIPLQDKKQFQIVLQHCVDMDNEAMMKLSTSARNFAYDYCSNDGSLELHRKLFYSAVAGSKC